MNPLTIHLPDSLKEAAVAYKVFSRSPLAFGWVLTPDHELLEHERQWLQENGFIRVSAKWYKRQV